MFGALARSIFGTGNERLLKSLRPLIHQINALEPKMQALSDSELQAQTARFRERLAKGETLDALMPEAFATVREASRRVLNMRHFDVQLVGGIVLHRGMISEMKTGEGKTLVSTLPTYLNALPAKGAHVVTVNDYLARRDAEWMGRLYKFLGLTVGVIVHGLTDEERKAAYNCDITYATNNELGFDYLRDNMKYVREQMVHRPFHYAIVDEVDSILIDEARTPLIISGPTEDNSELYKRVDVLIRKLGEGDYEKDEKSNNVMLTDQGTKHIEELLIGATLMTDDTGLYDLANVSLVHHVNQALRAHTLFQKDVAYIVKENKVVIIDEFTGRMMEGRRYSEGLHQALEAKEGVQIQNENQTLASITFQNYFRLYPKLAGMTGTAMTEAAEFKDIYNLDVVSIPTNVAVERVDEHDEIYRTAGEKYAAIVKEIQTAHERKQPVLVGTVSIEKSDYLSAMLTKAKIPHQVLNARHHEKEAYIIAQAGRLGGVTVATNMAGRGTDIMLGGNPDMRARQETLGLTDTDEIARKTADIRREVEAEKEAVREAGGLYVIGTERHESRRIDNQLRGRSGRQGDPGRSKFFLSLEDDLMRIFGSERIDGLLVKLGLKEGEAIVHPWMNRAIEKAQQKVENRNYDIRKNLLKFDNVMNDQRKVVYEQRIELMESADLGETLQHMREDVLETLTHRYIPPKSYAEQWDGETLQREVFRLFGLSLPIIDWTREEGIAEEEILERLTKAANQLMEEKEKNYGTPLIRLAEKRVLMQTLDQLWKDHLHSLDQLRHGIHLRGYGQRDPLNEYKQEAFSLFEHMLSQLKEVTSGRMAHLEIRLEDPEAHAQALQEAMREMAPKNMVETREDPALAESDGGNVIPMRAASPRANIPEEWKATGRNDACPCGSGKKFKHCHGAL